VKTVLLLSEKDSVLTCVADVRKGEALDYGGGTIAAANDIPIYHKIARTFIPAGEKVYKYGEVIGIATANIHPGEHVHVHNVEGSRGRGDKKGD